MLKRCKIHFTEVILESNYSILLRLWHVWSFGRCKILWPQPKKFCTFWTVNVHNTYQLNTFGLFPGEKAWKRQRHDELLSSDHDGHGHLWMVRISCDHYKWPVRKLFVDHSWLTHNDEHLFDKSFFSNNSQHFPQIFHLLFLSNIQNFLGNFQKSIQEL